MVLVDEERDMSRSISPAHDICAVPALGSCPELSRCLSTTSSISHASSTDVSQRESLGSNTDISSRQSSGSYPPPHNTEQQASTRQPSYCPDGKEHRRGYVRPQGTDFAASARSRASVLNLGSIAHVQYYFARTGLLDGKGAQLARKKPQSTKQKELQHRLQQIPQHRGQGFDDILASGFMSTHIICTDPDSSLDILDHGMLLQASDTDQDTYFNDGYEDNDSSILPPTVSTYNRFEKPLPRPPTIAELKLDLKSALNTAHEVLSSPQARAEGGRHQAQLQAQMNATTEDLASALEEGQGWHELQGIHVLDVVTLAIRAAKIYYTAHDHPARLGDIRSERQLRSDLLSVMEVLKHMATRNFEGGMKANETDIIKTWIQSVFDILRKEEKLDATERAERASWTWASPRWVGNLVDRELAFIRSIDPTAEPLPNWVSCQDSPETPTAALMCFQNGIRLINLHNAAVRTSRRRFGAIPTWHTDTLKPYRCIENLQFWIKAAQLRWEVALKIDPHGIVCNSSPQVWIQFEGAIMAWCRKVREEISGELDFSN